MISPEDEAYIREHLETYYAECRKKADEEQRKLDEKLRTDPATRDEWAWLEEQNRQQKERAHSRRAKAVLARAEAVRKAELRREEKARLKERVESLLRAKGVRLNLDTDGMYCGGCVSIEIDGELLVDTESFDLDMIRR